MRNTRQFENSVRLLNSKARENNVIIRLHVDLSLHRFFLSVSRGDNNTHKQ